MPMCMVSCVQTSECSQHCDYLSDINISFYTSQHFVQIKSPVTCQDCLHLFIKFCQCPNKTGNNETGKQ